MYGRLNVGVDPDHGAVKVRVVRHQNLRVPRRRYEDRVNAARDGRREYVGDLQADEEREEHDDCGPLAIVVVVGMGEGEVEVG